MIGLPSLHTLDGAQSSRIWLATEATDMRCGFDRLAERVRAVIGQGSLSGHLFVFRSRRGDRLKIVVGPRRISTLVLDGIDVSKLKRVPRYTRISKQNKENILV